MQNIIKKLTEYIKKDKSKKDFLNTIISLIVIISIALLMYNTLFEAKDNKNIVIDDSAPDSRSDDELPYDDEARLEKILTQIEGVGNVNVMITYESGKEIVPAVDIQKNSDIREEKNSDGSVSTDTREDLSKNVVTYGNNNLIVLKEIKPKVKGVIIVAEGAGSAVIQNKIINAATAIFDIPVNRIVVFEKKAKNGGENNE